MHRRRSARWLRREARDGAWLMASPPPPPPPPSSSVAAVVVGSFVSKVVDIFYRILFLDDTKNMKASTVPGNPILSVFSTGLSVWSLLFSNILHVWALTPKTTTTTARCRGEKDVVRSVISPPTLTTREIVNNDQATKN